MLSPESIAIRLADRNLSHIARATGLSQGAIANAQNRKASLRTIEVLSGYFDGLEKKTLEVDRGASVAAASE